MKPLSYWLSQIIGDEPIHDLWRSEIEELWNSGATEFRKIPVQQSASRVFLGDKAICKAVGKARPISCPELAPEGSHFELAYFDGVEWKIGRISSMADPEKLDESMKRWELIRCAENDEPGIKDMIFDMELRIMENQSFRPRESLPPFIGLKKHLNDPIDMDDLAAVFAAGVAYGRAQSQKRGGTLVSVDNFRAEHLRDVAKAALKRHGEGLGTKALLEAMGGIQDQVVSTWVFAGGESIDHDDFHKAVKAAKLAIDRKKSQQS